MNLSRRDLIIVALVVNVGILTLLVALATSGPALHEVKHVALIDQPLESPKGEALEKGKDIAFESHHVASAEPTSYDEIDALLEAYLPQEEIREKDVRVVAAVPKKKNASNESIPKKIKEIVAVASKKEISPPSDHFYVVQKGDNPWVIAKKFSISFDKLLKLNNLNEARAKNLKIGQRLKIHDDTKE